MLNVSSDQEITDIGTLHECWAGTINHTVCSFWETKSIRIATAQEIKECDEEMMQLFEKSVHFKYQDTR